MITIEILTTNLGCPKCERAMSIIDGVTKKYQGKIKVVKTDITEHPEKLIKFNVMSTPAIIINDELISEGSPKAELIEKKIVEAL